MIGQRAISTKKSYIAQYPLTNELQLNETNNSLSSWLTSKSVALIVTK